jgi:hypothetical protein
MTEVFELTYHGGGGFTYTEVWNMDVPKRRFNLKKINEYLEKVEEVKNKDRQKVTEKTDPKSIKLPDFVKQKTEKTPDTFVSKVKSKR